MDCISKRACEITPFLVMDVLEAAQKMERDGRNIIHMEIGEPDFDTPECIKKACCEALERGETHYTHSLGIPELRQAISKYHKDRYDVDVDPDRVIVTQGTSPAMLLLFTFLLDQGDNVITSDPCYACYDNFIKFAGADLIKVPTSEDDGFQFRPEEIAKIINKKTKAILINSPSNPTGIVLSPKRMKQIADLGPWIVSDEIYHGLVYGEQEHSILEYTDHAFVLNGFSKLFAMTGWRLGYIISPEKYVRPLQKLCQNFFISANSMAQWAGVAALTEAWDDVNRIKNIYDERRKFMIKRLREIGFDIKVEPTGAFYILVNMKPFAEKFEGSSYKLAFDILEKAEIGVTPGIDFGEGAEGYIRFSYANSIENIAEGMNRLEKYVKEFK
ncbi:pyridoxal phosphate-dependent aminotransferase [Maridesulfovibrio ferrireducens]|uniref:pyridoxal phosphate-dependent aminotransferase n=1 Tax=Maridesulfovibrio ferrireducens TaxID=246191 RepID=UPI001A3594F8|nr:pyridoxal phosphate-dependent aminotransferase [Maridesulfovibrio ferrireducens]MBI9110887.1 pyridoxal phosphate-dependent aminotransferase [Maridesulfovibrio ferrireducens]